METSADVHAKSIRETLARAQRVIIGNYRADCRALAQMLSQSASRAGITTEVAQRIEELSDAVARAQLTALSRHDRMPYRVFLAQIGERLQATYEGRSSGYEGPGQFRCRHRPDRAEPDGESRAARRLFPGEAPVVAHRHLWLSSGDPGSAAAHARASRGARTGPR